MLRKSWKSANKKIILFTSFLFAVFVLLVYLFPYSGDDWAWGSQIGLDRLYSAFDNYNGRYAGNLLVMALTRSELFNMVFTGLCLVCVCLFPKWFSGSGRFLPYAFGTLLFLLMPKGIFVQSVAWTAGFSNYVPPILLTFLYFILIRNIFDEERPQYRPVITVCAVAIGFVSALFMENVTLYNIAISGLIILFVFFKFRRVWAPHVLHFVASICGAVLMFTNSAYRSIANGDDTYRSTALGSGLKETIVSHTKTIFNHFFANNVVILGILSVLCAMAFFLFVKNSNNRKHKKIGALLVLTNVFSLFLIWAKSIFPGWNFGSGKGIEGAVTICVFALIAVVYCGSAFLTVLLCVKEKKAKLQILLLLISVPILIVPLLVVDPIGPRCFFPPYLMLIAACVVLVAYLQEQMQISKVTEKGVSAAVIAGCLALLVFFTSIYSTVHTYDQKRNTYAKKQVDAGYQEVTLCELPYDTFVWCGSPANAPWDERYKLFYGIDQDVEFVFVSQTAFDTWMEEFDKEVAQK